MSYVARVLVLIALVAAALLAWGLRHVWLLVFGAIIVAVIVDAIASVIARFGMGQRFAVLVTAILLAILSISGGWLVGDNLVGQFDSLRENLGNAISALRGWIEGQPFGARVLELWDDTIGREMPLRQVAGAAGLTLNALFNTALIVIAGIYLAAERDLYRNGLVRLVPPDRRALARSSLDASGAALAGWLKGQGISMLVVGAATAAGLALVGAPMPVALGMLAGLLEFVPYFGPIVAGVLAVLFAFTDGPQTALYVVLVMLAVQQVESNLVMPLAQKWTVRLPPVLGVFAVLVFGSIFGLMGVVLATPLMVVLMVLVRTLYVEHYLESRSVPGDEPRMRPPASESIPSESIP